MPQPARPCRLCQTGQRISTAVFAFFAVFLAFAAADPAQDPLRQMALWLCASLSAVAVLRFPIARLAAQLRPTRRGFRYDQ